MRKPATPAPVPARRRGTVGRLGSRARRARAGAALLAGLAALTVAGAAGAQPLIPGSRFNFNLSNPGARSLGFAGAFTALADDATACYANPAGLVQLTRPEVSVEWRLWSRSPRFLAGGRLGGEPTGNGIDTFAGPLLGSDSSDSVGPSFAAVVMPRGRFSFALYAHRLAKFEMNSRSQGFFSDFDEEVDLPGLTFRSPALDERVDLEILTAGLTAAWRVNDRLRLGLGVVRSEIDLVTRTDAYLPRADLGDGLFDQIPLTPDRLLASERSAIDGGDWTLQAGALWRPVERLSAGFFFRQGAEAEGPARLTGTIGGETFESTGTGTFRVPDVWGLGVAYRALDGALTLAGEIDRVGYEGLLSARIEGEEVVGREYRDAWEYHLGAEYALLRRRPIVALRAGAWVEANGEDLIDDRFTHLAIGVGIAGDNVQVDLAADFSEEIDTASVSFIYGF